MAYKNIIKTILIVMLIQTISFATIGRFNVPIYINDEYYGEYSGTIPVVTLSIYDENNKLMFEKEYEEQVFNKGRTVFILEDKDTMDAINHTSSKVGVFVPEFEEEVIVDIYEVPHARSAYLAQKVDWEGIENKPDLDALKFDHTITDDSDEVTLVLANKREKNNTQTGLKLSHDNDNAEAFVGLQKGNKGDNQLVIESSNEVVVSVDDSEKMIVSDVVDFKVPLKGDGSQLTNIPLSAVDITDSDIEDMGFLKSADMNDYVTYDDLNFSGANYQTSAASKIGVFDEFDNSDSILIQDVLDDLDSAISNKIASGINASNITSGTISDDRLPDEIEDKLHIESKDITVDTLTVKTIIYDTLDDDHNSGEGSSIFGNYYKNYSVNATHEAPTDGFITVYCNVHNHKQARISIYSDTVKSNVDSFSDSSLIAQQDLSDQHGTQIYNATISVPIPKGYYFHLKPTNDYKSCRTTWVGIGG